MSKEQLEVLANGLIAFCQRNEALPTNINELADWLQSIAGDEMYISKMELVNWLE